MANIGYIRVSTHEQNSARQLENIQLDKVFEEKISSMANKRIELEACINYLREGDTLHVHSIDRLARSLIELQNIVKMLNNKLVSVHFHTENILFEVANNNPAPMQELLFQILGAFAQFERNLIKERQREGIAKAKKEGRHLGRPHKLSPEDRKSIKLKLDAGVSPTNIAEEYGINVSSVYKLRKSYV